MDWFVARVEEELLNEDPTQRPKLSSFMQDPLFQSVNLVDTALKQLWMSQAHRSLSRNCIFPFFQERICGDRIIFEKHHCEKRS